MPFCPECRTEYQPGITQCVDCQLPLVDTLPPEPAEPAGQEGSAWVCISTDHDEAEAYVLKGFLESEGIACELENKTFHSQPTMATTLVNILVREDQAEQARQLLHEKEYLYRCSNCGAYCSLADQACPRCGQAIEDDDEAAAGQG